MSVTGNVMGVSAAEEETIRCFVPEMLTEYITNRIRKREKLKKTNPSIVDKFHVMEPVSFFVDGVCLLVDISGFTKLSGSFCAMGKSGIDELQLATNGYMGKLVEIIYQFGGDIIKFAGDAIICLFSSKLITTTAMEDAVFEKRGDTAISSIDVDGLSASPTPTVGGGAVAGQRVTTRKIKTRRSLVMSESGGSLLEGVQRVFSENDVNISGSTQHQQAHDASDNNATRVQPEVVLRAMHCAEHLKSVQTEKLTVHIGISCGEICFGLLGGCDDRWECLISGPCIKQLSDCLDDAPSKQAVITPECHDALLQYQNKLHQSVADDIANMNNVGMGGVALQAQYYHAGDRGDSSDVNFNENTQITDTGTFTPPSAYTTGTLPTVAFSTTTTTNTTAILDSAAVTGATSNGGGGGGGGGFVSRLQSEQDDHDDYHPAYAAVAAEEPVNFNNNSNSDVHNDTHDGRPPSSGVAALPASPLPSVGGLCGASYEFSVKALPSGNYKILNVSLYSARGEQLDTPELVSVHQQQQQQHRKQQQQLSAKKSAVGKSISQFVSQLVPQPVLEGMAAAMEEGEDDDFGSLVSGNKSGANLNKQAHPSKSSGLVKAPSYESGISGQNSAAVVVEQGSDNCDLGGVINLRCLGEMREVTTMFMKWDSYDPTSKHRNLLELQPCFLQAQKILHSTGAFLRQFLVDDKGCVLIACWGVPSMSYMDNAARALSTAAQMRTALVKLNMACSFGITTGDVYCGTVGSDLRMEYAAIGNVVNMAARLMGKAKGGILIDDTTFSRLSRSMVSSVEAIPPIIVKGRDEPLQVYKYILEGNLQLDQKVVEDHTVRVVAKNTFVSLLNDMADSMKHQAGGFSCGSFRVQKVVQTIRDVSTTPVMHMIRTLGLSSSSQSPSNSPANHKGRATPSSKNSQRKPHPSSSLSSSSTSMAVVLLQGAPGSGRTSIIRWLKKQAIDRHIFCPACRMDPADALVDYSVWRKLFMQMMPADMFSNLVVQRRSVLRVLSDVYGNDQSTIVSVAYPAMVMAFGITVSLDDEDEESVNSERRRYDINSVSERRHASSNGQPDSPHSGIGGFGRADSGGFGRGGGEGHSSHSGGHSQGNHSPGEGGGGGIHLPGAAQHHHVHVPPRLVVETILAIFRYYLNSRVLLLIIENVQNSDSESLKVLSQLYANTATRSSLVLTSLLDQKEQERQEAAAASSATAENHTPHKSAQLSELDSAYRPLAHPSAARLKGSKYNKSSSHNGSSASGTKKRKSSASHGGGLLHDKRKDRTDWDVRYRGQVIKHAGTELITLEDFTTEEINKMLCIAMNVDMVPPEILSLVEDFSGGGFTWVREILHFLQEYGAEEFMAAIGENDATQGDLLGGSNSVSISRHGSNASEYNSEHRHSGAGGGMRRIRSRQWSSRINMNDSMNASGGGSPRHSHLLIANNNSNNSNNNNSDGAASPKHSHRSSAPPRMIRTNSGRRMLASPGGAPGSSAAGEEGGGSVHSVHSSHGRNHASETGGAGAAPGGGNKKSRLELLVVCRFEKMSTECQHVLRTASIIGLTFSKYVLLNVLKGALKAEMQEALHVLMAQRWVYQDSLDHSLFEFAHPYAHGILYQLTPSNERKAIHQATADYLEKNSSDDPTMYSLMAYHNRFCNPEKSLLYTVQATAYLLENHAVFDLYECVDLLFGALDCCFTQPDVEVLSSLVRDALRKTRKYERKAQLRARQLSKAAMQTAASDRNQAAVTMHTGVTRSTVASTSGKNAAAESHDNNGSSGDNGGGQEQDNLRTQKVAGSEEPQNRAVGAKVGAGAEGNAATGVSPSGDDKVYKRKPHTSKRWLQRLLLVCLPTDVVRVAVMNVDSSANARAAADGIGGHPHATSKTPHANIGSPKASAHSDDGDMSYNSSLNDLFSKQLLDLQALLECRTAELVASGNMGEPKDWQLKYMGLSMKAGPLKPGNVGESTSASMDSHMSVSNGVTTTTTPGTKVKHLVPEAKQGSIGNTLADGTDATTTTISGKGKLEVIPSVHSDMMSTPNQSAKPYMSERDLPMSVKASAATTTTTTIAAASRDTTDLMLPASASASAAPTPTAATSGVVGSGVAVAGGGGVSFAESLPPSQIQSPSAQQLPVAAGYAAPIGLDAAGPEESGQEQKTGQVPGLLQREGSVNVATASGKRIVLAPLNL